MINTRPSLVQKAATWWQESYELESFSKTKSGMFILSSQESGCYHTQTTDALESYGYHQILQKKMAMSILGKEVVF